jgi:AAHS family 4-hydroxybenzoate transporter-like MFS transporter
MPEKREAVMPATIDLNAALERVGVGRLAVVALILCFLLMMTDGFDFAALSIAAPAILREWKLQPKEMGIVFSMTFAGLLAGSLIYGWMGDRFGRKTTIIVGALNFSIPVLLTIWASSVQELIVLRVVGGIGMGGVVPIAYTLVSEYAPRRMRSTVTVITNAGYGLGAVLSGVIASSIIPQFGWRSLFMVGAGFSLLMVVVIILFLPESALFLALKNPVSPRLAALVRRLLPNDGIDAATRFVVRDAQERHSAPGRNIFLQLFSGRARAAATALLWLLFVCDAMGLFFLASWLPVVMESAGVSAATASLTLSLFTFAGLIGGFAIMRFLDRLGPIAVIVLPIVGAPLEIFIGTPGLSQPIMLATVALAGICLSGLHYAVYAIAVKFYPPSIRGTGISSATVFGRGGGMIAPLVGGYLLSAHMPLQHLLVFAAMPCIGSAAAGIALGRLYRRHFETMTVDDSFSLAAPSAKEPA